MHHFTAKNIVHLTIFLFSYLLLAGKQTDVTLIIKFKGKIVISNINYDDIAMNTFVTPVLCIMILLPGGQIV